MELYPEDAPLGGTPLTVEVDGNCHFSCSQSPRSWHSAGVVLVKNGWMICLECLWTVLPFPSGILAVPFRCGGKTSNAGQRKGNQRHVFDQEQSPFRDGITGP